MTHFTPVDVVMPLGTNVARALMRAPSALVPTRGLSSDVRAPK